MSLINIQSISKYYDNQKVLDNVSLKLDFSKIHVLIGPSGCGKTTLLRLLLGLITPNFGEIWVGNCAVGNIGRVERTRTFGYLVQGGGLFPHLNAYENIVLSCFALKMDTLWIKRRVAELSELIGVSKDLLKHYPFELSGGQSQKISLIRALMLNPNILLLDEPMSSIDPINKKKLRKELKSIFIQLKKTVVMITHDLVEAAYFADQVVLLNNGRVIQTGTFKELYVTPKSQFVESYIKSQILIESK